MTHESASHDMEESTLRFADLTISPELKQGIKELGYVQPTDFQKGVFDNFQNRRHIVGDGQSSYGKSLAFALPILAKIKSDGATPQALMICESTMLADLALKEYRALSRHVGINVANNQNSDGTYPHVLVMTVDDLAKAQVDEFSKNLHTIFFDGLSSKNAQHAISLMARAFGDNLQILIFGDTTLAAFKESNPDVIDNAAIISNTDQPKQTIPAKHLYAQAKEAEPKPRALLGALEILKPKASLVTCNESQECELLSRYLSRYGYKITVISEDTNRHGLADAIRDCLAGTFNIVICQNSLLTDANLEQIPYMFNYDMFDRPQSYEHSTQFNKQAAGLQRCIVNLLTSRELGSLGPIKAQCLIDFSELTLPSEDEIMSMCAERIKAALLEEAREIELAQFEVLAKKIFDDPESEVIRSLLLRNYLVRAPKQMPRERSEGRDSRDRRGGRDNRRGDRGERHTRGERHERRDRDSHGEPDANITERDGKRDNGPQDSGSAEGITRLYITLGRKDGLFDLASLAQYLSDKSGVDLGHFSGSGMIRDTSAHIEVDDDVAEDIIKALHQSPRPEQGEGEEPSLVVCERARQSAPRHHNRRPPQRGRRHFSRRN